MVSTGSALRRPKPAKDGRCRPHGTQDAAGNEARSPIPAELIGGFADISLRLGMSALAPRIVGSNLGCGLDRRGEDHPQCIRTGLQVDLHVYASLAKHVSAVRMSLSLRKTLE